MKVRTAEIFTGAKFEVPERIQRIDQPGTHGWQLRYGRQESDGTEWFSDTTNDGSGAQAALDLAIAALQKRVRRLPAPSGLRVNASSLKSSDLPAGISGPTLRNANKQGKTAYYCYQVSTPVFGKGNTNKSFYIGTERTADAKRAEAALEKAVVFREEAARQYEAAKTKSNRAAVAALIESRKKRE